MHEHPQHQKIFLAPLLGFAQAALLAVADAAFAASQDELVQLDQGDRDQLKRRRVLSERGYCEDDTEKWKKDHE